MPFIPSLLFESLSEAIDKHGDAVDALKRVAGCMKPDVEGLRGMRIRMEKLKDNPLVKQFSLKSYNELIAAEHNISNKKLKLDPSRNDAYNLTFHDSCNPSRGMGILEEPRYIIRKTCKKCVRPP